MIRFQKRNFDIFATTIALLSCNANELWFAFKKGTLIYLQQLVNYYLQQIVRCDSLSKKELWYICNNLNKIKIKEKDVVIRFQKRNFDIFATTVLFIVFLTFGCDSLSKKELWYICNNNAIKNKSMKTVVIRFQKRNFDIFATTSFFLWLIKKVLWFAFKKGTLIYLQQPNNDKVELETCCDSLSKKELWYICNNINYLNKTLWQVVIRFQKRNFDIFATTKALRNIVLNKLWFAFKKGTLIYLQQLFASLTATLIGCDSLSKKELWYICNNCKELILFAFIVVIRFQKRNFDIFATTVASILAQRFPLWFAFKKGTLIYLQQLNIALSSLK